MSKKAKSDGVYGLIGERNLLSVLNRDALTPTLCSDSYPPMGGSSAAEVVAQVLRQRSPMDAIIVDLLMVSGCRVSEVCKIRREDLLDDRRVFVHGLKGSLNRVCVLVYSPSFAALTGGDWWSWENKLNRFYVYRMCREFGIYSQVMGNRRAAVSHYGRHALIARLGDQGWSEKEIADIIGHKTPRSTVWYLKHRPTRA